MKRLICFVGFTFILLLLVCSAQSADFPELKHYPVDDADGILSRSGTHLDKDVSADGKGSLRITSSEPVRIRLYETGEIDVEDARLIYRAKVRTEDVDGQVFLEMWCSFPGKGEYFSRALHAPLSGTTEWITQETSFFLNKGENPDNVKLNIVVNGKGIVWIDDIRLMRGPLR